MVFQSPPKAAKSLDPVRSESIPTRMKSAEVVRPWLTISRTAPDRAMVFHTAKPITMSPMWEMLE